MEYMSIKEAAAKWNLSRRRVQKLSSEDRIIGAKKIGNSWMIPINSIKPIDGRTKKYKNETHLPKKSYTSIDLFSGPGGLCTGFKWAGIRPLIAVEWSYWTVRTYSHSHDADIFDLELYLEGKIEDTEQYFQPSEKTLLIYGDIRKVEISLIKKILNERFNVESVDIVTGGAPCESFSMAGSRKEKDDRNKLYQNILRVSRGIDAKMLLFENVKGLLSKKLNGIPGAMYKAICKDFESKVGNHPSFKLVSYDKNVVLLTATNYGVPQVRERLFLVGINEKFENVSFNYPEKTHGKDGIYPFVTVEDALLDLPELDMGVENNVYNYDLASINDEKRCSFLRRMRGCLTMSSNHLHFTEFSLYNHKAPGHRKKMLRRIESILPGESMKTAYNRLVAEGSQDFVDKYFPKTIYGSRNRRLDLTKPSFTVTSHCLDEMLHPISHRGLSPREAARLQSFPDWYQFQGPYVKFHSDPEQDQYEQIGDAIPPLLAYALGVEVCQTLETIKSVSKNFN